MYTHIYTHFQQDCTRYGEKNCSGNFTWSHVLPASNSSGYEIYNGSSCKSFLQSWQECAIGQNEDVFVNASGDQKTLENNISTLIGEYCWALFWICEWLGMGGTCIFSVIL